MLLVLLGLSVRRFATKALVSALASNTNKTQTKKQTKHNKTKDYYELGVILTRKKLFTQATKNLEKAKKVWDGDESELAQVHNALGFCMFQDGKFGDAEAEYRRAVDLQPGYVTAWNNVRSFFSFGFFLCVLRLLSSNTMHTHSQRRPTTKKTHKQNTKKSWATRSRRSASGATRRARTKRR